MDQQARIDALQIDNERLRERNAMLERALFVTGILVPIEWQLTGSEARVLGVLLNRESASKEAIMAALYRDDGKDEAEIKIVDVFLCKLRRKLKPFDITIDTIWGQGYALSPAMKEKIKGMLKQTAGQA